MEQGPSRQVPQLFEAHSDRLVLYARTWLDPELARDVVQEAFVRLLEGPAPEEPVGWLYRVVRNLSVTRLRRAAAQARGGAELARTPPLLADDPSAPLAAADALAALARLPAQQREIVVLRIYAGLTFEAAAAIVGISAAGAFREYRAALTSIREHLESACHTRPIR